LFTSFIFTHVHEFILGLLQLRTWSLV